MTTTIINSMSVNPLALDMVHPPVPPCPDERFSPLLGRICEMGRFGQKTGAGWYRYEDGRTALPEDRKATEHEAGGRGEWSEP